LGRGAAESLGQIRMPAVETPDLVSRDPVTEGRD